MKGRIETLDKQLAQSQKNLDERDARLSKFDVEKRCATARSQFESRALLSIAFTSGQRR